MKKPGIGRYPMGPTKKEGKSTALEGYPVGIGSVHLHSGGLINNVGSHYQRGYTHWMDTLDTCIPWTYKRNNQNTLFIDIKVVPNSVLLQVTY